MSPFFWGGGWRRVANGFRTCAADFAAIARHKINYISSDIIRFIIDSEFTPGTAPQMPKPPYYNQAHQTQA